MLDQIATKNAIFITTAMNLPNPRDQYERWRRDWGKLLELADEITRMARLAS
jgi:hypothetical protein